MSKFDIIGDIHGCAHKLQELLEILGYTKKDNVYCQSERRVIFLGDFIDRGPYQEETLDIVRPMIESGEAFSVMGNHEFNAICYSTKFNNDYVRPHSEKNRHQHQVFLEQFPFDSDKYWNAIEWFKSLPVYLDFQDIGVIHACWCKSSLNALQSVIDNGNNRFKEEAYLHYADRNHIYCHAMKRVLKGPEFELPEALYFKDKDGHLRCNARVKWWMPDNTPTSQKLELNKSDLTQEQINLLEELEPPKSLHVHDKIIFIGHYWLQGKPEPLSKNISCVDYSVAKNGYLTAYRYDGERFLDPNKYFWV